jgi:adenylate cyclase
MVLSSTRDRISQDFLTEGARRLAAIMFTDMVGYTAMGQKNESLSLAVVDEQRKLIRPILRKHAGREVKTMGDSFLVEFSSALEAVRCAYDIQRTIREFNFSIPEERRVHLRVGVHLGDVVESSGDISGDAVNVASRIEHLAEDGGVCLTRQVYDLVQNKFELPMASLGTKSLKNVSAPVEAYRVVMPWSGEKASQLSKLDRKRVAILPFANMSPDPQDEYFADGITEEIISTASKISGLSVIARTSVMRYKTGTKGIDEIGRELNVGAILEGSLRKAGNRLRITAQLIDSNGSQHLWSEKYDREFKDVFDIQSDIAQKVAESLKVYLLPSEEASIQSTATENVDAYALYLKGKVVYSRANTEDDFRNAIDYCAKSLEIDPEFVPSYVTISACYSALWFRGYQPSDELISRAMENARRAVELDDMSAEAHVALSRVLRNEWDWEGMEKESRRAVELNPNLADAHLTYAQTLFFNGRNTESLQELKRAVDLDPLSANANYWMGTGYLYTDKYDEAIVQFKNALTIDPNDADAHGNLGLSYVKKGIIEEGLKELELADSLSGKKDAIVRADLAYGYAKAGKMDQVRLILDGAKVAEKEGGGSLTALAGLYAIVDERDKAFELLERAHAERLRVLPSIAIEVWFENIRSDPRFGHLLGKMGLKLKKR